MTTTSTPPSEVATTVDTAVPATPRVVPGPSTAPAVSPIPLSRLARVELRKSFDTRAGFWLLCSIGLAALATTGAIIAWAPRAELTYSQFVRAIGMPMTVILPIIAALAVTSEWTQRTGLTTFTLVPHRGRVLLAKALGSVLVALASTLVAFAVAAVGNVIAAALAGISPVWDGDAGALLGFAAALELLLIVGFTLGALIRNSGAAIVAYMIYAFVLPGVLTLLAFYQGWFDDLRPWVDAKLAQSALMQGEIAGDQWAHLAVTSVVWLVIPLAIGVRSVLRSEVK